MMQSARTARITNARLRIAAALVLINAATMVGCGYSSKSTFPAEVQTVAVAIFDNRSFYRDVEFDLTEATIKEIELRTPYKVADPGTAQTLLEGTITGISQEMTSRRDPGGLPQEMEVTITADFTWKDQRTGNIIRSRRGIQAVGRYIPTRGVGEAFETGQHVAVARLAGQIVSAMGGDW